MTRASTNKLLKDLCAEMGWVCGPVDRWIPHRPITQDFLGCIDWIVLDGAAGGPLAVQVTTGSNVAARLTKAKQEPRLRSWLSAPARFEVWGFRRAPTYRKDGSKGKRTQWVLRREALTLADLEPASQCHR